MRHSLYFLMRLRHARFPVRVDHPEEIKFVSVLKATGLIEADVGPAFAPVGKFSPVEVASVICITDEGMSELDRWVGQTKPGRRRA